jgi:hypothetical protein
MLFTALQLIQETDLYGLATESGNIKKTKICLFFLRFRMHVAQCIVSLTNGERIEIILLIGREGGHTEEQQNISVNFTHWTNPVLVDLPYQTTCV